ncbi:hypothetical protein [Chlorobium sp.]|jgi:hypothetical protein|uniref:hypothetical protein n=1 Tax=Chlorobium sp. TaxID=1095 RepID=UPI003C5DC4F2|nr:hypothetical protein [Chlorobiaceae bacterium]
MEQQNTGQKILDPIERAKLGVKVFTMPFADAEKVIDDYVSGKNYDTASVAFFKDQVATQRHIQEKSAELLATGGEIMRLVTNAFMKNLPKPPAGGGPVS